MKVGICYVCPVVNWPQFKPSVQRFIATSSEFAPEYPHELHVMCNGGKPDQEMVNLFAGRSPIFHEHDNMGWDIGAYRRVVGEVDCDYMLFLNTHAHFRRAGWLRRLVEAVEKFGPGLYGTSASMEIYPHIRTTTFMCQPKLVQSWVGKIVLPGDRHQFEVGPRSLTVLARQLGGETILVTWDGFYRQDDWRKAPNIYRRGDQSNCLIYDRHHEIYEASDPEKKVQYGKIADGNKFEYYRAAVRARLAGWLLGTI